MKSITLTLSLIFALPVLGQEQVFDGAIKLIAPKRCSWTIKMIPTKALRLKEKEESRSAEITEMPLLGTENQKVLTSIKVEKSGNLYSQISKYSDGTKTEKWELGSLQFQELEEKGRLVRPAATLLDTGYTDRSKEDFEELGWLTKEFYKGNVTFKGETCFLFQTTSNEVPETRREKEMREWLGEFGRNDARMYGKERKPKTPVKPANLPITVILSAKTRLPMLYNDGEIMRIYTFNTDNLGKLQPPQKFMDEFNAVREKSAKEARRVIPR